MFSSDEYIFSIYNIGYTGTTFQNKTVGTFRRVINPENIEETRSKYYVRTHKILTNIEDMVMTKVGFEKNVFSEIKKLEQLSNKDLWLKDLNELVLLLNNKVFGVTVALLT